MNQQRLNADSADLTCSIPEGESSPYVLKLKTILSDLIEEEKNGHIEYVAGARGDALYKDKDAGIQMLTLKKGDPFPGHVHETAKVWLIIITGSASVWVSGEETILGPRDHIAIESGQYHYWGALEDTRLIAISIPADEGYPNVFSH